MYAKFVPLIVLFVFHQVLSASILYISPMASPSHHIWNRQIALKLAKIGHNVTMLTHDTEPQIHYNLTIIHMEGVYEHEALSTNFDYMDLAEHQAKNSFLDSKMLYDWVRPIAQLDFETKGLAQLINYPMDYTFDLIIIDYLASQYLYPIIDRFNRPPVIAVTPLLIHHTMSPNFGGHIYPSYNSHYVTPYTNQLSFTERISNMVFVYFDQFYRKFYFLKECEVMGRKYFGDAYVRPMEEYESNFSLLLSNHDPLVAYPLALPPNIISVAALHAHMGNKLPKDLQHILDTSKEGVILFSFGTNVKSKLLRNELKRKIIEGLGRLKQTVIWKYEDDISGLPKNIVTRKWLPQNDMMEHPNLKLFITHGGALSTQEAMFHGVPIVGIPFFADQINNIRKMVSRDLGQQILISDLTSDILYDTVTEVLGNNKYSKACHRVSVLLKDKPQTSLDTAIYWIERTLKYGTIEEFRLPTSNMTLIEIYNLDILGVIALVFWIIIFFTFQIITKILCSNVKGKHIKLKSS